MQCPRMFMLVWFKAQRGMKTNILIEVTETQERFWFNIYLQGFQKQNLIKREIKKVVSKIALVF